MRFRSSSGRHEWRPYNRRHQPLQFELDGETFAGQTLDFAIQPGLLRMLL
jgi:diacylglycerol kinase family enzyme